MLDSMVFQAEAEVRWLDHCETSLVRHQPSGVTPPAPRPGAGDVHDPARWTGEEARR
ncbi:hypothetical protein NKG94_25195 [Micromonospora sp. M12]